MRVKRSWWFFSEIRHRDLVPSQRDYIFVFQKLPSLQKEETPKECRPILPRSQLFQTKNEASLQLRQFNAPTTIHQLFSPAYCFAGNVIGFLKPFRHSMVFQVSISVFCIVNLITVVSKNFLCYDMAVFQNLVSLVNNPVAFSSPKSYLKLGFNPIDTSSLLHSCFHLHLIHPNGGLRLTMLAITWSPQLFEMQRMTSQKLRFAAKHAFTHVKMKLTCQMLRDFCPFACMQHQPRCRCLKAAAASTGRAHDFQAQDMLSGSAQGPF